MEETETVQFDELPELPYFVRKPYLKKRTKEER